MKTKPQILKVHRRVSAAIKAAGDQPYLRVYCGGDTVYLTGFTSGVDANFADVELIDNVTRTRHNGQEFQSREVAGQITLRHLARLGNANHALTLAEANERAAQDRRDDAREA